MVFTEIDKQTMKLLCTLVKLAEKTGAKKEAVVNVGQNLGVPKEDMLTLLEEWEELDTMRLTSEEEKQRFVKSCFSYMSGDCNPPKAERLLYQQVITTLGLNTRSNN